jgi:hypothetical protein
LVALCPFLTFSGCLYVSGDANELLNNTVHVVEACCGPDTERPAMRIAGNQNILRLNQATSQDGPGLLVTGTGNDIQYSTVLGTTLDLHDANGDCVHNTWAHNTFVTADPPCLGAGSAPSAVSAR